MWLVERKERNLEFEEGRGRVEVFGFLVLID